MDQQRHLCWIRHKEMRRKVRYISDWPCQCFPGSPTHETIRNLSRPPKTMDFTVKEQSLFCTLKVEKQVHVGIKKEGAEYVVVGVR